MIITIGLAELSMLSGGSSRAARGDLGAAHENPTEPSPVRVGRCGRGPSAHQTPLFTPAIPALPPRPMHPAMPPGRDPKVGLRPMDASHGQLFGDRSAGPGPVDTPRRQTAMCLSDIRLPDRDDLDP
ncbi:hypothetical protein ACIHDR_42635 [Nocardia sp. NPDC052278]|uniref:hypothetical protein n=1 Tax=unclassified Nocardia TaxID=2637762 RepID=UPI0036CDBAC5